MDALLRRGIARPSAFIRWLFDGASDQYGASSLASSFAPLELLEVGIERALDAVSAARLAMDAGAPGADAAAAESREEARAACRAAAEGLEDGPGATVADARAELGRILVRAAAGGSRRRCGGRGRRSPSPRRRRSSRTIKFGSFHIVLIHTGPFRPFAAAPRRSRGHTHTGPSVRRPPRAAAAASQLAVERVPVRQHVPRVPILNTPEHERPKNAAGQLHL